MIYEVTYTGGGKHVLRDGFGHGAPVREIENGVTYFLNEPKGAKGDGFSVRQLTDMKIEKALEKEAADRMLAYKKALETQKKMQADDKRVPTITELLKREMGDAYALRLAEPKTQITDGVTAKDLRRAEEMLADATDKD